MKPMLLHTKNRNTLAILGALSLFLSLIEYLIPKPIPFIKLGMANISILLSLILLTPKETLVLIFIKSVGGSLVTGTIFSWVFLYSISGSFVSGIIMLIIYNLLKEKVSMVGISIAGALGSNLTQIALATLFLGNGAKYIGIPILISGFISGILTGLFSNRFINESKWIRSLI